MAAPSKHRAYSPCPANAPPRSFPSQYHTSYTSQYQTSAPTSAPVTSPFTASYDGLAELSPDAFGPYTSPSPHDLPLFNAELHAHQLSLQEKGLSYQNSSSPSLSSGGETYGGSSPTYTTNAPSSTPTTPYSQTPQHASYQCHSTSRQTWEDSANPCTPLALTAYEQDETPLTYLTTTSPSTHSPIIPGKGEGERGGYIGTPSTPPSPLYYHVSSPDLTTPTTAARARYRSMHDTPPTPLYFRVSSPVATSPMSEGSEFGGALVGESENPEASKEVRRLMADREGRSRFPGSLRGWVGFESPAGEKRRVPEQEEDEQVSPRTNTRGFKTQSPPYAEKPTMPGQAESDLVSPRSNSHSFGIRETPLLAETPSPLAAGFSPLTSPPQRRTYSNANAYRHFVPPPGPSSPLPPAPHLPLPEPRYSEHYSINPHDANVTRAHQLLEEHMKNRWGSVLSANSALQEITGTSGMGGAGSSKAPVETAAATLMQIKTGVPRPRPLLPGFNTPMASMQCMQAERAGRVRSLRSIYDEYVTLPHAKAVDLCSLSIHAVSGSFGSGSAISSQPAKLQNELLAHFTAAEGATAIQFLEIDMANPTGGYNQHPFERWAFFVIAMPMVCGPGGVDGGYVGGHERASMVIAAPLRDVIVDGGKAAQDVLGDGTVCLRRDFVFGPGVAQRMEFWDKYTRWIELGERAMGGEGGEWLCAEIEGVPHGRMEGWGKGEREVLMQGVRRDVERWRRVRGAMQEGVCRIVTRVVDYERVVREERARERRKGRERAREGGDWEREGVREVEGGSSVKKPRRGR